LGERLLPSLFHRSQLCTAPADHRLAGLCPAAPFCRSSLVTTSVRPCEPAAAAAPPPVEVAGGLPLAAGVEAAEVAAAAVAVPAAAAAPVVADIGTAARVSKAGAVGQCMLGSGRACSCSGGGSSNGVYGPEYLLGGVEPHFGADGSAARQKHYQEHLSITSNNK